MSDSLTYTESRIAALDEIELEAIVWGERDPPTERLRRYHDADRAALREIDRLKIAGTYEAERARLAAYLKPPSPQWEHFLQRAKAGEFEPWENFSKGLHSPDPDQRERFERLYREGEWGEKTPREFWYVLECLEPAKGRKTGRPKAIPPWHNVAQQLDAMRLLVSAGDSIPQAAREQARIEGLAHADSRADYFDQMYRERMALREIK